MAKGNCPFFIRGFDTGLKCVCYHGGNAVINFDCNSHCHHEFVIWNNEQKKTGSKMFREKYCYKGFTDCRFYKERQV
jgi:hypothetical protein